jgi:putative ABC transport system permease protein
VTISILALAIAFFAYMLGYGIVSGRSIQSARQQLDLVREQGRLLTRLSQADLPTAITERLAFGVAHDQEYAAWGGLNSNELTRAKRNARRLVDFEAFVDGLEPAQRAIVLAGRSRWDVVNAASDERGFARLWARLDAIALPDDFSRESVRQLLLVDRRQLTRTVEAIRRGHEAALEAVRERHRVDELSEVLQSSPGELAASLRAVGFSVSEGQLVEVADRSSLQRDGSRLREALLNSSVSGAIVRRLDVDPAGLSLELLAQEIRDLDDATWLSETLSSAGFQVSPAELLAVLDNARKQVQLEAAVGASAGTSRDVSAAPSPRSLVLLGLSLLVCVIGVANALLMSVTERFSEIATMKCLGALDRSVMLMFVFEAAFQGLVGGVIGVFLGLALACIRSVIEFGSLIVLDFDVFAGFAQTSLICVTAGLVLSAVAATLPAWLASRLAPMEAMRVE